MEKVSVIIPTYNRFDYLLNCIKSIQNQTVISKNQNLVEIIVVNDCSTQKEYNSLKFNELTNFDKVKIKVINLEKNTKQLFGYACAGYVRNEGIKASSSDTKYIAFCDDDDIWFPNKLEFQIKAMKETGCKMSSTEGLFGKGIFNPQKLYPKYNSDYHYKDLKNIYNQKGNYILNQFPKHSVSGEIEYFPKFWDLKFIQTHNCIICSSVLMEKELLDKIDNMKNLKNGEEDYDCWLRALEHTNSVYIEAVCFYYDGGHGDGQNY